MRNVGVGQIKREISKLVSSAWRIIQEKLSMKKSLFHMGASFPQNETNEFHFKVNLIHQKYTPK